MTKIQEKVQAIEGHIILTQQKLKALRKSLNQIKKNCKHTPIKSDNGKAICSKCKFKPNYYRQKFCDKAPSSVSMCQPVGYVHIQPDGKHYVNGFTTKTKYKITDKRILSSWLNYYNPNEFAKSNYSGTIIPHSYCVFCEEQYY